MIPAGLPGLCSINGRTYTLAYNATLPEAGEPVIHGYRLTSTDTYKAYDVDADGMVCDCEDATYRQRACKHALSLRLFREQGKLA